MENSTPDLEKLLEPVFELDEAEKPLWGKMTPQHMIEHLGFAFRMSNGKQTVPIKSDPERLPALRRFLKSDRPMPRNYVNPITGDRLLPLQYGSMAAARKSLFREVKDFYSFFEQNPEARLNNPVFGKLNFGEWLIFHRKHIVHHLAQFGCMDESKFK